MKLLARLELVLILKIVSKKRPAIAGLNILVDFDIYKLSRHSSQHFSHFLTDFCG